MIDSQSNRNVLDTGDSELTLGSGTPTLSGQVGRTSVVNRELEKNENFAKAINSGADKVLGLLGGVKGLRNKNRNH